MCNATLSAPEPLRGEGWGEGWYHHRLDSIHPRLGRRRAGGGGLDHERHETAKEILPEVPNLREDSSLQAKGQRLSNYLKTGPKHAPT